MGSLLIRNVDDALHTKLKLRAREHHRSLEEEVRETLRVAVAQDAGGPSGQYLLDLAASLFGPENGIDLDLPSRKDDLERPPPDFSGDEYGP